MNIAKAAKTTNVNAQWYVQRKIPFIGSNIWGEILCEPIRYQLGLTEHEQSVLRANDQRPPLLYVVYSYGEYFPMYIYDYLTNSWYGNSDKYSRSTTEHQDQCRPTYDNNAITWMDTEDMKWVVYRRSITGIIRAPSAA